MAKLGNGWRVGQSGPPDNAGQSNQTAVRLSAENGFTAYEATYGKSLRVSGDTLATMWDDGITNDVVITAHGVYYTSVLNNPDQPFQKTMRYVGGSLRIGEELLARGVVIHPGAKLKDERKAQYRLVANRLERMFNLTGLNPELCYLETMGKVNHFGDFPELMELSRELNTRVCLDWAHEWAKFKIRTNGAEFTRGEVQSYIERLAHSHWYKETHHHLSGMQLNGAGEGYHLGLESNTVPWKMIIQELIKSPLGGTIVVETDRDNFKGAGLVKSYMEELNG